tara:strand:+ start:4864 stop:5079 length:216 start_codon:yes stop_codon:yes gene_type:complete
MSTKKEVRENFMKDVKFLKKHGNVEKGTVISYHKSTATALEAHKIVEIIGDTKIVTVVEDNVEMTKHETKK